MAGPDRADAPGPDPVGLLPQHDQHEGAGACPPGRLQHARLAPPEVPGPRADQLGRAPWRAADRDDAPSDGQGTGRGQHRRPGRRGHRAEGHGRAGLPEGSPLRPSRAGAADRRPAFRHGARDAAGRVAGHVFRREEARGRPHRLEPVRAAGVQPGPRRHRPLSRRILRRRTGAPHGLVGRARLARGARPGGTARSSRCRPSSSRRATGRSSSRARNGGARRCRR